MPNVIKSKIIEDHLIEIGYIDVGDSLIKTTNNGITVKISDNEMNKSEHCISIKISLTDGKDYVSTNFCDIPDIFNFEKDKECLDIFNDILGNTICNFIDYIKENK